MASLVVGVVGAAVGFAVGGPSGALYGFQIGATIGGVLFPGSLPTQYGPRLADLKVQVSTYGTMINIYYGTIRGAGNVIWSSDIRETKHKKKQGGKGGPSQTTVTYTYSVSAAVSLCVGEILGVRKIWADNTLMYDVSDTNYGSIIANATHLKIYTGSETQLPDPTIESYLGVGNVPAYRGQAYVVFTDFQLEKFGNRLPNFTFEVVATGSTADHVTYVSEFAGEDYGTYQAFAYNPLLNEVWTTVYLPDPPYADVARVDAITGDLIGFVGLPDYIGGSEIIYDNYNKCMWVLGDESLPTTFYKIDAGTGAVLATGLGNSFVFMPDYYTGQVWTCDLTDSRNLIHIDVDTLAVINTYTLPFFIGAATYGPENGMWIASFTSAQLFKIDRDNGTATEIYDFVASGDVPSVFNDIIDLAYDQTRDILWVYFIDTSIPNSRIIGFNQNTNTVISNHTFAGTFVSPYNVPSTNPSIKFYDPYADYFWLVESGSGAITGINASTFETEVTLASSTYRISYNGYIDSSLTGTLMFLGHPGGIAVGILRYNRLSLTAPYLDEVVTDLSVKALLSPSDINVGQLASDLVHGYGISRQTTVRSCIEQLQQGYFFDAVESDNVVKFVKRGQSVAVTIPLEDLGAHDSGSEVPDLINLTRMQEVDLPSTVNVVYFNPDADYQNNTQQSRRLIGATGEIQTIEMPIVFTDSEARQIVDKSMFNFWTARNSITFKTSNYYAIYEPTDVIVVGDYTVRIVKKNEDDPTGISWEAVFEDNYVYTQTSVGTPAGPVDQVIIGIPVATNLVLMDIPMLRDQDNNAGFYYASNGYLNGWAGAVVFKSDDNGDSYNEVDSATNGADIGVTTTVLGNFTRNAFDEKNTVNVRLGAGQTISSVSRLSVLNGNNAALIGDEIVQYMTATLEPNGSYTLSGLLRGRRGTEWAMGTHAIGERFVNLETSTISRVNSSSDEIGLLRLYKGVTIGDTLANTQVRQFTNTAISLKPYSPCHLGGGRNTSSDVIINWERRSRTNGAWNNGTDAALGEETESYDIEIWDSSYSTLKRTLTSTTTTKTYTSAQQVTDFGGNQSTVYVRIYQKSAVVGRGYKLEGTV